MTKNSVNNAFCFYDKIVTKQRACFLKKIPFSNLH